MGHGPIHNVWINPPNFLVLYSMFSLRVIFKKTTKTWVSWWVNHLEMGHLEMGHLYFWIPAVPFHVHLPWGHLAGWLQELREPADEVPVAHPFGWSFSWHSAMVWSGVKATGTTGATGLWGYRSLGLSKDFEFSSIKHEWGLDQQKLGFRYVFW